MGLVGWWRRVERDNLKQIKDEEKKQEIEVKMSSIRKRQTSAKHFFINKFFPDKEDRVEPDVESSQPGIILSTPSKSIIEVAILLTTGSKRKREVLEGKESKMKKQKLAPSIAREILFLEGKSNSQEFELGTAQHALMRSGDLVEPVSKSTAGGLQGYEGK